MAIIGIDLGTTNSLAAYWKDGVSRLIPCDNGRELVPSAVGLDENGKYIVGREAKDMFQKRAENIAVSFKRFMGTDKQYQLACKNLTPTELSALVLQHIRKEAERYLRESIEEAIITVPAYFNDRQRSDTKKAAQLAGLHVERLINEPSAAALAYRRSLEENSAENAEDDCNIIVFDFGGGTLDLSYVECFENIIEIVAVAGDNRLGGDDIDKLLAEYYCMENHIDPRTLAPNVYAELVYCAERAKRKLSEEPEIIMKTDLGADLKLDEDMLFQICMPLFERIRGVFLRLMRDADIRISDLDALVMVGGSSKLLVVQKFLTELLGKRPVLLDEADKVVAIGAGVYAGIRERREEIRDLMLTDVCPFTLGIDCGEERRLEPIIPRNTTLPAHRVKHFVTLHDFQRFIEVNVYQGEEYYAKDNLFLSGFEISIPGARAGVEGIDIHFTYDINGLLHVEAYNSRKEHKDILIANQELTETELENYKRLLADLEMQPEEQPENKELLDRLTALYENLAGEQKEYVGGMIAYYLRALQRGRRVQIRKIREQITKSLGRELFSDEWQEAFRFNGELKFELEDTDWEDIDSEGVNSEDEGWEETDV